MKHTQQLQINWAIYCCLSSQWILPCQIWQPGRPVDLLGISDLFGSGLLQLLQTAHPAGSASLFRQFSSCCRSRIVQGRCSRGWSLTPALDTELYCVERPVKPVYPPHPARASAKRHGRRVLRPQGHGAAHCGRLAACVRGRKRTSYLSDPTPPLVVRRQFSGGLPPIFVMLIVALPWE